MPRPAHSAFRLALLLTVCSGASGAQAVPESPASTSVVSTAVASTAIASTVTVQAGDTAYSIARRTGISVDALLSLNGLSTAQLRPGQVLRVQAPRLQQLRVHVVQPGDTLYALARRYAVSVDALLFENTLPVGATLRAGQTLKLPTPSSSAANTPASPGAFPGTALAATTAPTPATVALPTPVLPLVPPLQSGVLGSPFLPTGPAPERPTLLAPSPLPAPPTTRSTSPGPTRFGPALPVPARSPLPADWRAAALSLLGTPYRYGAASSSGTDCSGLVLQVFTPLGVSLPRVSADQARVGQPVGAGEWQGGDLVFFDTEGQGRVSHVGIYLGDDTFISANSYQGRVTIDRLLADPYWSVRYLGARRVLTAPVVAQQ